MDFMLQEVAADRVCGQSMDQQSAMTINENYANGEHTTILILIKLLHSSVSVTAFFSSFFAKTALTYVHT